MHKFRIPSPILIMACVLGSTISDLKAHDLWITATVSPAAVKDHDPIAIVELRVGHATEALPVPYRSDSVVHFTATPADGATVAISGDEGQDPAGSFPIDKTNRSWIVSYQSHPRALALPGPRFEAYLREEGLDDVVRARAEAGRSNHPGLERFSRFAKSLLCADKKHDAGATSDPTSAALLHDRPLGLPLELVLETTPAGPPPRLGRSITVRLLLRGEPLEGALVRMEPTSSSDTETMTSRSDSDGRVTFTPRETGHWMIGAVFMEASPPGTGARWDSLWASLTFAVHPKPPAPTAGDTAEPPPDHDSLLRLGGESPDSVDCTAGGTRRPHS